MKVRLEYSKDTWHKVQFKEAGGEKYVGNVYSKESTTRYRLKKRRSDRNRYKSCKKIKVWTPLDYLM